MCQISVLAPPFRQTDLLHRDHRRYIGERWCRAHYASLIDCMIWNIAEPQTTKMKSAKSQGPTGYWSSFSLVVLGTFPLMVMFLLAISLAIRILCLGAISVYVMLGSGGNKYGLFKIKRGQSRVNTGLTRI